MLIGHEDKTTTAWQLITVPASYTSCSYHVSLSLSLLSFLLFLRSPSRAPSSPRSFSSVDSVPRGTDNHTLNRVATSRNTLGRTVSLPYQPRISSFYRFACSPTLANSRRFSPNLAKRVSNLPIEATNFGLSTCLRISSNDHRQRSRQYKRPVNRNKNTRSIRVNQIRSKLRFFV